MAQREASAAPAAGRLNDDPGNGSAPATPSLPGPFRSGDQFALSQVAVKLLPPLSAEIESLARPEPSTMMIFVGLKFPIAEPFTLALLKVTGLKCASGRTPLVDEGASAMTSADE